MCRCDYVAIRGIVLFSWYGLNVVWDSLGQEYVGICQFVHGLAFIYENVLNYYLDDSTSNLNYVPKIFKRSR